MTTCGFCYKDYSGKLEDHLKREHFQDIGNAASYGDPSIHEVIDSHGYPESRGVPAKEMAFSFYILWMRAHAHAMRQRKVLDDNEWAGWLHWMRTCFQRGTLSEIWKLIEPDRWFNPAFRNS